MNTNACRDVINSNFVYDQNSPCYGCPNEGLCALGKLACEDFVHFVSTGENQDQVREPSAELYHELFPSNRD